MQPSPSTETRVRLRKTTTLAVIVGSGLVLLLGFAVFMVTTNAKNISERPQLAVASVPTADSTPDTTQANIDTCYEYNWDTTQEIERSTANLNIKTFAVGNSEESVSTTRQVKVINIPFETHILTPHDGDRVSGMVRLTLYSSLAATVFWNRDGWWLKGGWWLDIPPYEFYWNSSLAGPGWHELRAWVYPASDRNESPRFTDSIWVFVEGGETPSTVPSAQPQASGGTQKPQNTTAD